MDRSEIVSALEELSEVLNERGVNARIYVVRGAAMSLAFGSRYSTEDVDVDAYPTEDVISVAREIAHRRGLPQD
jgi:predicted nucleotidyltransferase